MHGQRSILAWLLAGLAASGATQEPARPPTSPDIAGVWLGKLQTGAITLRVAIRIERLEGGILQASFDSIDQGAKNLPVDDVSFAAGKLAFAMKSLGASYSGTVAGDGTKITGTFLQAGARLPLTFERTELRDYANGAVLVQPRLNATFWGGTDEGEYSFKYVDAGGTAVQTPRVSFDFDRPSWKDRPRHGDTTVQVAGAGGQAFSIIDVDLNVTVGSGAFASEAYVSVTLSSPLDYLRRYWIKNTTTGSDYSTILVPEKEQGTPESLSTGNPVDCVTEEPYINFPEYEFRASGCANGDQTVVIVGAPGVSTIVFNGSTALIQNPVLTSGQTASYMYPTLPDLGVDAKFAFPVPNDPDLGDVEFYVQVAIWDATANAWRFSEVVTKKIWVSVPFWAPQGEGRRVVRDDSASMRRTAAFMRMCQIMVRQYGYQWGSAALRRR